MTNVHSMDSSDIWASAPPTPLKKPAGAGFPPRPDDIPGTVFLISSAGEVLKLPIPSGSPRDPLNWSWPKRIAAVCGIILATSVNFFEIKLSAVMSVAFQQDFATQGVAPTTTDYINTFAYTMTAMGLLLGVALSTAVGRRPVLLASAFINTIATAMAGFLTGFGMLFISIGGQGVASGMILAMGLLVVLDGTFIFERPWAISIHWGMVSILVDVYYLPLFYLTDSGVNWRPVYRVWVLPCAVSFLLILFLVPETFYVRPPVALDGRVLVQSASEHIQIYDTTDALGPSEFSEETPAETRSFFNGLIRSLEIERAPGTNWRAAGSICVQMVLCACNPLVVWASLLGGVILAVTLFQCETQYKYIIFHLLTTEPLAVQLHRADVNFAISGIASALVSIPLSGPLITWHVRNCARRSGGTRHAEVYLIGYIIPIVTAALAVCLFAVSTSKRWPIGMQYFIYAIANVSYILVFSSSVVWLTEAFPLWAAASIAVDFFVVVMLGSFLSAKLGTWASAGNILGPSILQGILVLVLGAVILPIAFWGKNVRQFIHGRWSLSQKGALRPQ